MSQKKINRGALPMFSLALPLVIEQFMRVLVSSVDTFMVSGYSEKAVAGIGLVAQYVFFLNIIFSVIITGTTIVLSQYLGAEKSEKELNYVSQASSVMTTVVSLLITVLVLCVTGPLLSTYDLEDEVRQSAYDYFTVFGGIGAFFIAFNMLQSSILRCYGYTKEAMIVTLIANLLNVGGNAIALYGPFGLPVLGVPGVAWSSTISQIVSFIILGIIIARKKDVSFNLKGMLSVPQDIYRKILKIGVPTAGESLSYNVAQITVMAMISTLGTFAINSHVYTQTIVRYVYATAIGIGSATQIKIGHYVGAGEKESAYRNLYKYSIAATLTSTLLCIGLNFIKMPIIELFTQSPDILKLSSTLMLVAIYIEFGRSLNLIYIGGLKGAGDVRFPVLYGIFSMWTIIVGLGAFLGLYCGLGLVGFWIATGTEETTRGIVMFFRWRSKRWQNKGIV
ncbi:MAG: MATE family efflux transporter [Treponema sp.]|nr:MATE family efflux transporter [Treponema sp.]